MEWGEGDVPQIVPLKHWFSLFDHDSGSERAGRGFLRGPELAWLPFGKFCGSYSWQAEPLTGCAQREELTKFCMVLTPKNFLAKEGKWFPKPLINQKSSIS